MKYVIFIFFLLATSPLFAQDISFLNEGDRLMQEGEYVAASKQFSKIKDPNLKSEARLQIEVAKSKACVELDKSIYDIFQNTKLEIDRMKKDASYCKCNRTISQNIDRAIEAKKAESLAYKYRITNPKEAALQYTKAYRLTGDIVMKQEADKINNPSNKNASVNAPVMNVQIQPYTMQVAKTTVVDKDYPFVLKLSGISVDDHAEDVWGWVDVVVRDDEDNKILHQSRLWSTPQANPLRCNPYKSYAPNNVQSKVELNLNESKLLAGQYSIEYSVNLACGHKDNDFAAWGAHPMGRTASGIFRLGKHNINNTKNIKSTKFATQSNRRHDFMVHWVVSNSL